MSQSNTWYSSGVVTQSLGENYDRYLVPVIFAPWATDLVAIAAPRSGERILDVACGTGAVAREAAKVIGTNGIVTGLDLNAGMLDIARRHDTGAAIQWYEGSAQAMPFSDAAFTLVLCQQGMQYFPDRAAALREMYRVLAAGGQLVLSVWRAIEHSPGYLALDQAMVRHISPHARAVAPFSLGDATELVAEVTAVGFTNVATQTAARFLRYNSPEEFVRTFFTSTPAANLLPQLDEAKLTALVTELSSALHPYIDSDGLAFPIESQIITAHR